MNRNLPLLLLVAACLLFPAASRSQEPVRDGATVIIPLDGAWHLTGYSPDRSRHVDLEARVPGQVHVDLLRDGLIPDPFWRDNAEQCQWVEQWQWRYKRAFHLPDGFDQGRVQLQFDGLDTYADIFLNGRKIGTVEDPTTDNMFVEYAFEVSGWLKPRGENVLEVRFRPIGEVVGDKAKAKHYPAAFGDPWRAYVRRMQCTFGWDWVHRLVTAGIWRPCRLVAYPEARVENTFVYTQELQKDKALLRVQMDVACGDGFGGEARMTLTGPDGKVVWSGKQPVGGPGTVALDAQVEKPALWWPNGSGEQPLYKVEAAVYDKSGKLLHRLDRKTGIRTVGIEQIPDKDGSSFTILINGERIFAKGGNWIPADPFPSRITPERYAMLVGRAADAGMNMVRVWGGGIYEQEPFWAACDSLGIMAWHDFMLACGGYPEDQPGFADNFIREAECNVVRLRNHPSLIIWCGDNELGMSASPEENWPFKATHRDRTAPLLAHLDPSRPFRPSSPHGLAPNSPYSGDAHLGGQYSDEVIFGADASAYRTLTAKYARSRFLSESTTAGTPTKRSLLRFMTEEDLDKSEMFDYHTKDNPYVGGGLTLFGKLESLSEKLYGEHEGERERRLRQMEYTQYEFVRQTMEAARANKFYSSGVLFWMLNDCWPASGWSLMDYWGDPKAGWYAMKAGCRPVIAATQQDEETLRWWLSSDAMRPVRAEYTISVQPLAGGKARVLKKASVEVPANGREQVLEMPLRKIAGELGRDKIVVFEVRYGNESDRSYWTPLTPREVAYPATRLSVSAHCPALEGEVRISSDKWGRVVTLEGAALFEDNYFEMLPGETRAIKWRSLDGGPVDEIRVSAWNAK